MAAEANIHPGAKIGKGTVVEPFATIASDVVIGDNCWIGANAVIMDGARIGNGVRIFPGAVISAIPQDLKFQGEQTTVEIGDNSTIREFVTINRGTSDRNTTRIGENCLVMAYVHVAHDCLVGNHCILANNATLAGHVVIEDYAILEGFVAVQQFIRIGEHSFIAGTSKVRKDVPPYVRAAREPLAYSGINSVGLRRRGFSEDNIGMIEHTYRIIYIQNQNTSKALDAVKEEIPENEYRDKILNFISDSDKGVIRGNI